MKSKLRLLILLATVAFAVTYPSTSGHRSEDDADEAMHPKQHHKARRVSRATTSSSDDETDSSYWNNLAQESLKQYLNLKINTNKAKNIILFLGDGMSIPTLMAARTYLGQLQGHTGEETKLFFEHYPFVGLSKTYCVDRQVPDSACTATAYLCGVKNNEATIGVNAKVELNDCDAMLNTSNHVTSIAEWAQDAGKSAGIVTTTRVTHASPSGTYAHTANRNWESDYNVAASGLDAAECRDIASQLVYDAPGKDFKVILGGGRREFLPNTTVDEEGTSGRRRDGVNLINVWKQDKDDRNASYKYLWNRNALQEVIANPDDTDYLLGLFEASHCAYHLLGAASTEPTLSEMTEAAIKILEKDDNGYFLFVEGGRIDHAHHDNYAHLALDETVQFAAAVQRATELTSESDTLIVVTSDHAHVMSVAGYPSRGNDIFGIATTSDLDSLPYTTLGYTNGPGYKSPGVNGTRYDVSNDDLSDPLYQFPATVPLSSETHGGDDVAIFAHGPWSHLFRGTMEQNNIPHFMAYAACIGRGLTACTNQG